MNPHAFTDTYEQQYVERRSDDETIYQIRRTCDDELISEVRLQVGPARIVGVNGVSLAVLLGICIDRLRKLNEPPNNTITQRQTLNHLSSAMLMLDTDAMERSKEHE